MFGRVCGRGGKCDREGLKISVIVLAGEVYQGICGRACVAGGVRQDIVEGSGVIVAGYEWQGIYDRV